VQKETASSANAEKPPPGRSRFRAPAGGRIAVSTTTSAPSNGAAAPTTAAASRPTFNKVNINRRRGRPTTAAPGSEEPQEGAAHSETGQIVAQTAPETATPKSVVRTRLPGAPAIRPAIRPGGRINLRQKPGQLSTTTLAPEVPPEGPIEEPAGEGTEEETHEVHLILFIYIFCFLSLSLSLSLSLFLLYKKIFSIYFKIQRTDLFL